MNSLPLSSAERLARALTRGLRLELSLTPKPGLVDLLDSGSHPDLSFPLMTASTCLVGGYFEKLASALGRGVSLAELTEIGRRAEERMLATFGTNTHKGAIFLGGLLLVACFRADGDDPESLSRETAAVAEEFFAERQPAGTNGQRVRDGYRAGGVIREALAGMPSLFAVALPAWRWESARSGEHLKAAWFMMGRLMQTVEDTTALHRCGEKGLDRLRRDGLLLESTIAAGGDPLQLLRKLNDEYRRMNLTMGGVADLLGLAFGYLDYQGLLNETSVGLKAAGNRAMMEAFLEQ
jgi:triphosphoribosyl-dephospho-CoA synthase